MQQKVIVFGVDGLIPELVYKFSQQGYLPNLTKMLIGGSSTELLPFIPTWGDVNWLSFITGQTPGNCWVGQRIPPENKDHLLGLMEEQGKRAALVHFPETMSVEGTNHVSFAPFAGDKPAFEISPPTIHSTRLNEWPVKTKEEFLGWPYKSALAYHEKQNRKPLVKTRDHFELTIDTHDDKTFKLKVIPVDEENIAIELPNRNQVKISPGEWSTWMPIIIKGKQGVVRFKLLTYCFKNKEIDLLQSQINVQKGFCNDEDIERSLLNECGPFISKWTVKADPKIPYHETAFEEAGYQANWLAQAALTLLKEHNIDLFATVFRLNDETHHTCLGEYDPVSPFYSPEQAEICEQTMRKGYEILDQAVGKILDGKSEDTMLILASDHGNVPNVYFCDIYRRLEQCGLAKLDKEGDPVWSETKAYLKDERGGLEIYINLKGREKKGIVDPRDYDTVQADIVRALTTWCYETPHGQQNVVGLVLKKQDAVAIGYWGSAMGDVIFSYNQGFVWGRNERGDVVAPVSAPGANHGPQLPSARTGCSSNYGIAIFHSTNSKPNYQRDCKQFGPYSMDDVGVTISRILGLRDTPTLDGRYMDDLFQK